MGPGMMGGPTNQSGMGAMSQLPVELKGWNWGAFWLTWIWGIFNGAYLSLIGLAIAFFLGPLALVWSFVCGAKGNEWAWKGKRWNSVAHFKDVQRKWSIAGLIVFILIVIPSIILWIVLIIAIVSADTTTTYETTYPVIAPLLLF